MGDFFQPSSTRSSAGQMPTVMDRHNALMRISPEYAAQYYLNEKDAKISEALRRQKQSRTDPITALTVGAENDPTPFGKAAGEALKAIVGDNSLELVAGSLAGYGIGKTLEGSLERFIITGNRDYVKEARSLFATNKEQMANVPFDETLLNVARGSVPLYPNKDVAPVLHNLHVRGLEAARKAEHLSYTGHQSPPLSQEESNLVVNNLFTGQRREFAKGEVAKTRTQYVGRTLRSKDTSFGYGSDTPPWEIDNGEFDEIERLPRMELEKISNEGRQRIMDSEFEHITPKDKEAFHKTNAWHIDANIPDMGYLTPLERGKKMREAIDPIMEQIDNELGTSYSLTNSNSMSTNSYPISLKLIDEYIRKNKFSPMQTKVVFSPYRVGYNSLGKEGADEGRALARKYIERLKKVSTVDESGVDASEAGMYHFIRLFGLAGAGLGLQNQGER